MRKISFKCDGPGCKSETKPNVDDHSIAPPGWFAVNARDGVTQKAMGCTMRDGGHACSKKCALAMIEKGLDHSNSVEFAAPFVVKFASPPR